MSFTDHSALPKATPDAGGGTPPDKFPRFGRVLVDEWMRIYSEPGRAKPFAIEGTEIRLSWSGECGRALSYHINKVEPTDPMNEADYWRLGLGTMVHDALEAVIPAAWPGASIEQVVDLRPHDLNASGSTDVLLVLFDGTKRIVIEVKTINGTGFRFAVGAAKGSAQGPRTGHLIQACMAGLGLDADEVVLLYFSMELLSPDLWKKVGANFDHQRFMGEWTYTREEYEPIAKREKFRMQVVLDNNKKALLTPRHAPDLPKGARITNPMKGTWDVTDNGMLLDSGATWHCNYCGFRKKCIEDGPS